MIKLEAKRLELNFLLKLLDLKSNLTLALSYLNPALNNPAQEIKKKKLKLLHLMPYFLCAETTYKFKFFSIFGYNV